MSYNTSPVINNHGTAERKSAFCAVVKNHAKDKSEHADEKASKQNMDKFSNETNGGNTSSDNFTSNECSLHRQTADDNGERSAVNNSSSRTNGNSSAGRSVNISSFDNQQQYYAATPCRGPHTSGEMRDCVFRRRNMQQQSFQRLRNDLEVLTRPSWCDAQFAYDQVCQGKANGSKFALSFRAKCQNLLFRWGCFVQKKSEIILVFGLLLLCASCVCLKWSQMEFNVEKLWVESGSQLQDELKYTKAIVPTDTRTTYQVLIQTGDDVTVNTSLLLHLKAAIAATQVTVTLYDQTWGLSDVCYKEVPDIGEDGTIETLAEGIFPCTIIGPLDCFWEGSKLLGPDVPLELPIDPNSNSPTRLSFTWENLDPQSLLTTFESYRKIIPEISALEQLFEQAGITHGYLDKWCLNPYDPNCPNLAPNKESKKFPDIPAILSNGCHGYASKLMEWPNDLVVGGIERSEDGNISSAQALQTTFQLWGTRTFYNMYRLNEKTNRMSSVWDISKAQNILESWQRKFVETMYKVENDGADNVHAFTPTTAEDLVMQFSNFSLARVVGGYLLMMAYACITMMRCKAYRSQGGVAVAGVLLVALSVIAGLGISSVLNIKFNAATTQVLPFLMLGLAVDDMFLIAYQFGEIAHLSYIPFEERTGECLKRVGVSVLLTSLAILSAFLFSLFVPMPALQSFAMQAAIITAFNLFCVLCIFPSVLSIDLMRRQSNRLDILCCFKSSRENEITSFTPIQQPITCPLPSDNIQHLPPVETNIGNTTVTVHHTIQEYSNQSYQTHLGPAAQTSFISASNPQELYDLPDYSSNHVPVTPPPQYSTKLTTPEPVNSQQQAPQQAFQERSNRTDCVSTVYQPTTQTLSTTRPSTSTSRRIRQTSSQGTSRATSNFVTPLESLRSSTRSLVPVKSNSNPCSWFCGLFCKTSQHKSAISRSKYDHVKCCTLPTVTEFAQKYYAPFLLRTPIRVAVVIGFLVAVAISVFGCLKVRDGLDLIDILPRGSREHDAIKSQMDYFSFYNMYIITKEYDYASNQRELNELHNNITNLKYVVKNSDGKKTKYWMHYLKEWLQGLQDAFDRDWKAKTINQSTWTPLSSDQGVLAFKLLLQTGDFEDPTDGNRIGCRNPNKCDRIDIVRLVSNDGIIREDGFYNYLTAWVQLDPLAYAASQANFNPLPEKWEFIRDGNLEVPRAQMFNYTQMPYYLNELKSTEDFVSAIKSVRRVCDYYQEHTEVRAYPSGYPFLFWQQYITLRLWLFVALGALISAIFVVISIALYNPWAGSIITLFLALITTELLGFMGLAGVKLSAIPVVILIASVGIGVEFTVHMMLAFITSCGNRLERAQIALGHMSSPVLDGAISTLLGIVMLSGSEFDFITKYFFHVLSMLVLIGFLNGIVLLPVILSFIGPPPEVQPVGGGSRLKTPTPPPTPAVYNHPPCGCQVLQYHSQNLCGKEACVRRNLERNFQQIRNNNTASGRTCRACSGTSTPNYSHPRNVETQMRPNKRMGFYSKTTSGCQTPTVSDDGGVVFYPGSDFVMYNANPHAVNSMAYGNRSEGNHHYNMQPHPPIATVRSAVTVQVHPIQNTPRRMDASNAQFHPFSVPSRAENFYIPHEVAQQNNNYNSLPP